MKPIRKFLFLNQMAGTMFRELCESLASNCIETSVLLTGHAETARYAAESGVNLEIVFAPQYSRRSWILGVISWIRYLLSSTPYVFRMRACDSIVMVSNPPFLVIWIWLLTRIRSIPYIIIVYDIYPDVLERQGLIKRCGIFSRLWKFLNRVSYSHSVRVVTLGAHMRRTLDAQLSPKRINIDIVPIWVDTDAIKPLVKSDNPYSKLYSPDGNITILYSGNMGVSHDMESLLLSAKQLLYISNLNFLFIGGGKQFSFVEKFIQENNLHNSQLLPLQPESIVPFTMALGDISIVALDSGMEGLMTPSKVISYFSAGSAVIAIANQDSDLADLINKYACGIVIPPRDPRLLTEAILELIQTPDRLQQMKSNARNAAINYHSKQVGLKNFNAIFGKSFH